MTAYRSLTWPGLWLAAGLLITITMSSGCGSRKRTLPVPQPGVATGAGPSGTDVSARHRAPLLVRVGLAVDLSRVELTSSGAVLLRAGAGRRRVARLDELATIHIRPGGQGVRWTAAGHGGEADVLYIEPVDPHHQLQWQDVPYRGEMLLVPGASGATLVNIVELDTYLRGVLPWEIGHHETEAATAVAAQAVAARTYTISHLGERETLGFDLWADVQDQVYRGAAGEDSLCDQAILQTRGQVLRHANREIEAYYCSTCGGITSNVAEVWPSPERPYLRSHPDAIGSDEPFCAASPRFRWEETWNATELASILARTLPQYVAYMSKDHRATWAGKIFTPRGAGADTRFPGEIRDLVIAQRTASGRSARLDITTAAGTYHVRGDRMRWVLPPADGLPAILWSALCSLEMTSTPAGPVQRLVARGRGFGHGVGMCQHGALGMARLGYSYQQILAHYYPGARLEQYAAAR